MKAFIPQSYSFGKAEINQILMIYYAVHDKSNF